MESYNTTFLKLLRTAVKAIINCEYYANLLKQ